MARIIMNPEYYEAEKYAAIVKELLAPEALEYPFNFDKHPPVTSELHRLVHDQKVKIDVIGMNDGDIRVSLHNYVNINRDATKPMKEALENELKNMFGADLHIEYDKPFPDQLMLSFSDMQQRIQHSQHPAVKAMLAQQQHERELEAAAQEQADKGEYSYEACLWNNVITDRINEGPYFATELLKKLSARTVGRNEAEKLKDRLPVFHTQIFQDFSHAFERDTDLINNTVAAIREFGANRLSFLSHGASSLAFKTLPDAQDKQRVVLITPENEKKLPTPLLLPPLAVQKAEGTNINLLVRVMPEVETGEAVTDADVEKLIALIRKSGLEPLLQTTDLGHDLRKDNVGILEYDKIAGNQTVHVRLPIVLDWGSIVVPEGKDIAELQARWKDMPELRPYFEAQEYLRRQINGRNLRLEHRETRSYYKTRGVSDKGDPEILYWLMRLEQEYHLSPEELRAVQQRIEETLDKHDELKERKDAYWQIGKACLEGRDMSQPVTLKNLEEPPLDPGKFLNADVFSAMVRHQPESGYARRIEKAKNSPSEPIR